jgi:hypothetical protein
MPCSSKEQVCSFLAGVISTVIVLVFAYFLNAASYEASLGIPIVTISGRTIQLVTYTGIGVMRTTEGTLGVIIIILSKSLPVYWQLIIFTINLPSANHIYLLSANYFQPLLGHSYQPTTANHYSLATIAIVNHRHRQPSPSSTIAVVNHRHHSSANHHQS